MSEEHYSACLVQPISEVNGFHGVGLDFSGLCLPPIEVYEDEITPIEEEPFLVNEHKTFHFINFVKSIGISLVLAEGLTLTAIGLSTLGIPPLICKVIHGLSCGVSKNVTMVQYADLFKQFGTIQNINNTLKQHFPKCLDQYVSKDRVCKFISDEIAVTGLSLALTLVSDARSGLTSAVFCEPEIAANIGLAVPDFKERLGGVIVKRLVKDVIVQLLQEVPYLNFTYFPIANTVADIARGISKDIYCNYFKPVTQQTDPLAFGALAQSGICSLAKHWGSQIYKGCIRNLFESTAAQFYETNSFSFSYLKNLASSTFSSLCFTVCNKVMPLYLTR